MHARTIQSRTRTAVRLSCTQEVRNGRAVTAGLCLFVARVDGCAGTAVTARSTSDGLTKCQLCSKQRWLSLKTVRLGTDPASRRLLACQACRGIAGKAEAAWRQQKSGSHKIARSQTLLSFKASREGWLRASKEAGHPSSRPAALDAVDPWPAACAASVLNCDEAVRAPLRGGSDVWMFLDATGVRRSRRSAQPAGMVSSTPRKKGAAPGTTYLNAFTSTISSAVNGVNGHPHQDAAAEKEAFVPKTSGDIFAPKRCRLSRC